MYINVSLRTCATYVHRVSHFSHDRVRLNSQETQVRIPTARGGMANILYRYWIYLSHWENGLYLLYLLELIELKLPTHSWKQNNMKSGFFNLLKIFQAIQLEILYWKTTIGFRDMVVHWLVYINNGLQWWYINIK